MRIPPLTTLRVEDFSGEERKWLPRLFNPLNAFLTAASNALNGRIEFGSNIPCLDSYLQFNFDGLPQRYRWPLNVQPTILIVGQATENALPVSLIPMWSFDSSTQNISVSFTKVGGQALTVGVAYRVFVRAIP